MSGKRAKAIRREIYGDYSIRARKYYRDESGKIFCDDRRRAYQKAKKEI